MEVLVLPFVICPLFVICDSVVPRSLFQERPVDVGQGLPGWRRHGDGHAAGRRGSHLSSSIIARVESDEVPYPDDPPAVAKRRRPARHCGRAARVDESLAARPFAELIATVAAEARCRCPAGACRDGAGIQLRGAGAIEEGRARVDAGHARHGRSIGVRNSYDPQSNMEAGVRHLKFLLSRLDLPQALAAYNAGEATIQRYGGLPPVSRNTALRPNILRRLGRSAGN